MTDDELIERYILFILNMGDSPHLRERSDNLDSPDVFNKAVELLVKNNLIVETITYKAQDPKLGSVYQKTGFYNKVVERGGWIAYTKEQKLINAQIQSVIDTNENVKNSMRKQTIVLMVTVGISIISLAISWLSYKKPSDTYLLPMNMPLQTESPSKLQPLILPNQIDSDCVCPNDSIIK